MSKRRKLPKPDTLDGVSMLWVRNQIASGRLKGRNDIVSSINKLIGILGPLETIPADGNKLRARLNAVTPEQHGEVKSYWCAIKCRALKALRLVGLETKKGRDVDLDRAWLDLFARVPSPRRRSVRKAMIKLAKWATREGLAPHALTPSSFEQFENYMMLSFRSHPRTQWQKACNAWDAAVDEFAFWPQVRSGCPKKRLWYARSMAEYPQSLQDEIDAMFAQRRDADRSNTRWRRGQLGEMGERNARDIIKMFLHHLCETGVSPASLTSLSVAITPANARRAIEHAEIDAKGRHAQRRGSNLRPTQHGPHKGRFYAMACELRSIAYSWLEIPSGAFDALVKKLNPKPPPITFATDVALRYLEYPPFRRAALLVGREVLNEFTMSRHLTAADRATITGALAYELSIKLSIPLNRLARLQLGRDVSAAAAPPVLLGGSPSNPDGDVPFPPVAAALLNLYLTRVRRARTPDQNWLFPGLKAGPRNSTALGRLMAKVAAQKLAGKKVHSKDLRYLAAIEAFRRAPKDIETVRAVLGLRSFARAKRVVEHLAKIDTELDLDQEIAA